MTTTPRDQRRDRAAGQTGRGREDVQDTSTPPEPFGSDLPPSERQASEDEQGEGRGEPPPDAAA
jgi:hypothetical protein